MIIREGDELYDILMTKWRAQQGGNTVPHGGYIYQVVKDNEEIRFSRSGEDNPFQTYGDRSFR